MVSADLKSEAWLPESDLPLILLTLDHDDLVEPLRVVNNKSDITSNGEVYTAFPFEIELPSDLEDAPPNARLRIDNVSREIGQTIRSISTPPSLTVQVVRGDAPDTVELEFSGMVLRNVRYDALTVQGDLEFEDLTREPFPAITFSPADFPGLLR